MQLGAGLSPSINGGTPARSLSTLMSCSIRSFSTGWRLDAEESTVGGGIEETYEGPAGMSRGDPQADSSAAIAMSPTVSRPLRDSGLTVG